jgi:dethiobiotin synthetase
MRRIVVLGTGTAVGKTVVAAHLVRGLRARSPRAHVLGLKPVETGWVEAGPSDAAALASASESVVRLLHALRDPVSPHLAARRVGLRIEVRAIVDWVNQIALSISSDMVVLETAGGALSPLSETETNLDLARALEPADLVLVAPDSLGVLHDMAATVAAMRALHRAPDHVVLSRSRPADASTGSNAAELERLGLGAPRAVLGAEPALEVEPLIEALLQSRACQ